MLTTDGQVRLRKRQELTVEPAVDDYGFRLVIRQRRNWSKLDAESRANILLARATVLDEYARQMREEADLAAMM